MSDIDRYLTEEVAEKALAAGNTASECYYGCPSDMTATEMHAALSAVLPEIIQQAKAEALEEGDGYHTHEELYEYRMLYNAHAARGWLSAGVPVVKSWRHSDGELCFGGGWFVVYADLPAGQVSNHYRAEHWDLFDVPAVELPPEYDGHTPAEAANRLRAHLIERGARP